MERQLGKSTLEDDARRLLTWIRQEAGGLTHNILSATHPDTTAGTVTRGDLIVGESTPKWNRLALGTANYVVGSDGSDVVYLNPVLTLPLAPVAQNDMIIADATPAWSILTGPSAQYQRLSSGTSPFVPAWTLNLEMADDAWIGLGAAAGRIIFDSTPNPDQAQLAAADLYLPASHGIIHADGVTAGHVLRADGTRYIPADPTLTVPLAPVAQGDIIIADGTPAWSILTLGAAAGYALISTASTAAWDQTPTWTGDHTWDDGSGDSPALKLVGGSNDDTVTIFLDDDATAGDSDLIVRLCDTAGDSLLILQDSGSTEVWSVTSDGEMDAAGHCAIGDGASVNASYALYVDEIFTDTSGTKYAVLGQVESEPAAGFTTTFIGVYGSVRQDTAQTQSSGRLTGVEGRAGVADGIAATILALDGGRFGAEVYDATVESAKGVLALTPYVDAGTLTTGYGIHISRRAIAGAGSITTLHGLLIDSIVDGGTNHAIYTNEGLIRLGGIINYAGAMGNSTKDPMSDAPVDWVECQIAGTTRYLPAYAA
jgi:hypothetical protein